MKKNRISRALTNKQVWSHILVLVVGCLIGSLVYKQYFVKSKKSTTPAVISKAVTERSLSNKNNLEEAYKTAQKRISTGVERKEITQEQADKLNQKLTEIYEYRKGLDASSKTAQKELSDKRREWRKWLDENKLSLKYIIPIYWN